MGNLFSGDQNKQPPPSAPPPQRPGVDYVQQAVQGAPQQQPGPYSGGYIYPPDIVSQLSQMQPNASPSSWDALKTGFMHGLTGGGQQSSGLIGNIGDALGGQIRLSGPHTGPAVSGATSEHSLKLGAIIGAAIAACLHPDTPITLADGSKRAVRAVTLGNRVRSRDLDGADCGGIVTGVFHRNVPPTHELLEVVADPFTIWCSPEHPLPDGSLIKNSSLTTKRIAVGVTSMTCDLLIDSPTGVYFSGSLALGSTLDPRHTPQTR